MVLSAVAQSWVNLILVWIGFGAVTALIVQLFLPGSEPKGYFGHLVIGIAGTCVGTVGFSVLVKPEQFQPVSPVGFLVAVVSSSVLLLCYRGIVLMTLPKEEKRQKPNGTK